MSQQVKTETSTKVVIENPKIDVRCQVNEFGEIESMQLDNFVVIDRGNELLVDHNLGINVVLEVPQHPYELEGRLLDSLWSFDTLIDEDSITSITVPFLDSQVTQYSVEEVEIQFWTGEESKWFNTGIIPILDLNLAPNLVVDCLVRAITEVGVD